MTETDNSKNPILMQDEILQVLYWMRGENLSSAVTLQQLQRFLNQEETAVQDGLHGLLARGLLIRSTVQEPEEFTLSESGIEEGRRRFQEEFDGLLGHESHLVCDDPNCDCHREGADGNCLTRVH